MVCSGLASKAHGMRRAMIYMVLGLLQLSGARLWAQAPGSQGQLMWSQIVDTHKPTQAIGLLRAALKTEVSQDSLPYLYLAFGRAFLLQGKVDSARTAFQEALRVGEGATPRHQRIAAFAWEGLAECQARDGLMERAIEFQLRAHKTLQTAAGTGHESTAWAACRAGQLYLAMGDTARGAKFISQAGMVLSSRLPAGDPLYATFLLAKGELSIARMDYALAQTHFEEALALRQQKYGSWHPEVAAVLVSLSRSMLLQNRADEALTQITRAREMLEGYYGSRLPMFAPVYATQGDIYFGLLDFLHAEEAFQMARSYYSKSHAYERAVLQYKIASCLDVRGMEIEALNGYDSAAAYLETVPAREFYLLPGLYEKTGGLLFRKGSYARGLPFFQRAAQGYSGSPQLEAVQGAIRCLNEQTNGYIQLRQRVNARRVQQEAETRLLRLPKSVNELKATHLRYSAMLEALSGRYDNALALVRRALGLLWSDRNPENVHRPVAPDILMLLAMESSYMVRTNTRASNATGLLETALRLNRMLYLEFCDYERYKWQEAARFLYGTAVDTYFSAWKQTSRESYLQRAFQLSEEFKTAALLKTAIDMHAPQYRDISSRTLASSTETARALFGYERRYWQAIQQEDGALESYLEPLVRRYRAEYLRLNQKMQQDAPRFFRLFYPATGVDISRLRPYLDVNQVMVSYFIANEEIFVFVLSKTSLQGIRMKKDFALEILAANFMSRMRVPPTMAATELEKQALRWVGTSQQLFVRILAPVMPLVKDYQRLIISPDGPLRDIAFDALLMEPPAFATQFKSHAYLGRRMGVSYIHSAHLLQELYAVKKRSRFSGKYLLSMVPEYTEELPSDWPTLKHTAEESKAVRKLLGGRVLKGEEASLENFESLAPEYRMVHLPVYARARQALADSSFLAFAGAHAGTSDGLFVTPRLFQMTLKSDLVMLSRLDAPVEAFRQGEGLLGLKTGLYYAGAKSLALSLWSADAPTSATLVERFFHYVRGGLPKDVAMQRARQDFLNQRANLGAHPYYWAGMVLSGNMMPEPDPRLQWVVSWVIALVGLGIALTLYWRWIQKRNPKSMSTLFGNADQIEL